MGAFSAQATGLTAGTIYSFKAFATNAAGTSYSPTGTFTATSARPELQVELPAGTPLPSVFRSWGLGFEETANITDVRSVASGGNLDFGLSFTVILRDSGTVSVVGPEWLSVVNVPPGLTNVVAVSAGERYAMALKADGTVVTWGDNASPPPVDLSGVTAVAAGHLHHVALKSDGTVVVWGNNDFNQLNVPAGLANVRAIAAAKYYTLALREDGTVIGWGLDLGQEILPLPAMTGVTAISAGITHALALKSDGTVVTWGSPWEPQATLPPGLSDITAISAGGEHSMALKSDGTVISWGGTSGQSDVPVNLKARSISAGGRHSAAVERSAIAYGEVDVGSNLVKTLTLKNIGLSPLAITGAIVQDPQASAFNVSPIVETVSPGASTTLAVSFAPTSVGAYKTTLRILNDSDLANYDITLTGTASPGLPALTYLNTSGVTLNSATLSAEVTAEHGATITERGFVLSHTAQNDEPALDGAHVTKLVSSDTTSTFSADANGLGVGIEYRVKAYVISDAGTSYSSTSGFATEAPVRPLIRVARDVLEIGGDVQVWGQVSNGQADIPAGLKDVIAIDAGGKHTLALRNDLTVAAWGSNTAGQSTVPADLDSALAVSAGDSFSMALTLDGRVVAWGANDAGQTHLPSGIGYITAISAGGAHALALRDDSTVVAWGANTFGQSTVPAGLIDVIAISAGGNFSLALKRDGTVVGWGSNDQGSSPSRPASQTSKPSPQAVCTQWR